jgi:hypothetical protein
MASPGGAVFARRNRRIGASRLTVALLVTPAFECSINETERIRMVLARAGARVRIGSIPFSVRKASSGLDHGHVATDARCGEAMGDRDHERCAYRNAFQGTDIDVGHWRFGANPGHGSAARVGVFGGGTQIRRRVRPQSYVLSRFHSTEHP